MNMKLEVVIIPVSDVNRAKGFYEKLGFRLDGDFVVDEKLRVLQFTPPRSEASIIFGKGVTSAKPGLTDGLVLAVDDIDAARADLVARGVEVSEVFLPLQQFGGQSSRQRARPGRSHLLYVCVVRGSRRERLAAPGDQGAPSRPRMEAAGSTSHGRRDPCRAPPRNGPAPRPLREDARRA